MSVGAELRSTHVLYSPYEFKCNVYKCSWMLGTPLLPSNLSHANAAVQCKVAEERAVAEESGWLFQGSFLLSE